LEGYNVASVASGEAAIEFLRLNTVDLVILDLRMHGMSGLETAKVIRRVSPDVELILLTAHGSMETAIEALRQRVHDYLLKPASPAQVLESVSRGLVRREMRLKLHLGDIASTDNDIQTIRLEGNIEIDFQRRIVQYGSKNIHLTPAEGRLLKILVENSGKVFPHRELVLLVQGYAASQQEAPEILRPLVSRLRQKLSPVASLVDRIVSVRGTGYLFEKRDDLA
jgi:DNA-binding response OmpR family regulator